MTATPPSPQGPPGPRRWPAVALILGIPLIGLAAALAWTLTFVSELPDPVATHWGSSGADGFGSWWSGYVVATAITLVTSAISVGLVVFLGREAMIRRTAVGIAVWTSVLIASGFAGTLALQRELADAADAPDVGGVLVLGLVAATVVATGAVLLVPGDPVVPTMKPVPADAHRLEPSDVELPWRRSVEMPGLRWTVIAAAASVVVLVLAWAWWTTTWWMAIIWLTLVPVVLVLVALSRWHIVIDDAGLTARPVVGFPRIRVPLEEVEAAGTASVRPFRDFGGWGYRVRLDGGVGLVLRAGPALVIDRSDDRQITITLGDAADATHAAALLNTLASHARP